MYQTDLNKWKGGQNEMKARLITVSLVLTLLGLIQASTALAEPQWLLKEVGVLAAQEVEGTGELHFVDLKTVIGEITIACKMHYLGTVNFMGKDQITQFLDATGKVVEELKNKGLACTAESTCDNREAELWPEHLPVNTQLEETLEATLDRYFKTGADPGITVLCLVLGLTFEDTCLGPTSAVLKNVITGGGEEAVLATFSSTEQEANAEQLKCSQSGEKSGLIRGEVIYISSVGLALKYG